MTDIKQSSQQEVDGHADETAPSQLIDGVEGEAAIDDIRAGTDASQSQPGRRSGRWLAGLLLLVIIGIVALTYFRGPVGHWFSALPGMETDPKVTLLTGQVIEVEEGLAETQIELRSIHRLANDNQKSIQELGERLEGLGTQQEEYQQEIGEQITEFNRAMGSQMSDWRPIEVRHLLFLADTRLHLVGDLDGATEALHRADRALQKTGERRWLPLREKTLTALAAVKGVERVDIEGVRIRLRLLESQIVALSGFAQLTPDPEQASGESLEAGDEVAVSPAGSANEGWRSRLTAAWDRVTTELASYISVYHAGEEVLPALSHPQLQGLKFQLVGELRLAEAALLRGDSEYNQRLMQIDDQIGRYFDAAGQAAQVIRRELKELQAVVVTPELPDISEPLRWLDEELDNQGLPNG
ncbi:MAG: uroporphyrinogen-III C-methyltransferase [Immundisolibacteraceae bacterium]|nr:uroporphyrinogen-III C-methyltransferase [Immundisolibacteraceae bacterium]